jgi:hypothetical protein
MAETLELRKRQERNAAKISTACLFAAMLTMAAWGWTDLKYTVSAVTNLTVFGSLVLVSIFMAITSVYRGIQKRALKAKLDDQT